MAKSKGRRVRRWIWIGVLGLAIAGGAFALTRPKGKPGEEKDKVKTAKAEVADVQVRVTEVGSVEPDVKVDVKSVLSGKVVETMNAGGYTYVCLEKGGKKSWVAVPEMKVVV